MNKTLDEIDKDHSPIEVYNLQEHVRELEQKVSTLESIVARLKIHIMRF